jgi:hypothetical protein
VRRVRQERAGTALRPVRRGEVPGSPQRQRAAHLPELLAPGPAQLETWRQVRELPARRRDHRGRAGLPELPAGSRCCLQHLRVSRQPDRHVTGHPRAGVRPVLLILLYAQKPSVIAALTTQHVLHEDGRTLLRLGSRPIVLPAPLDALVGALAGGRKVPGTSLLSVPSSWLFPGRRPGSPLTEDALGQRLHALGISPRQGRGTALFTLATDVPAAILAKTLGTHVKAAIQWQKISGGDWSTYAADVSRRSHAQERARAGDQRADPLPSA